MKTTDALCLLCVLVSNFTFFCLRGYVDWPLLLITLALAKLAGSFADWWRGPPVAYTLVAKQAAGPSDASAYCARENRVLPPWERR